MHAQNSSNATAAGSLVPLGQRDLEQPRQVPSALVALSALAFLVAAACEEAPTDLEDDTSLASDAIAPDSGTASDTGDGSNDGAALPLECPGGGGCGCSEHGDCDSGLCIETPSGKQCARTCVTDCPSAYLCAAVSFGGADTINICVPRWGRLCDPCQATETCAALGLGDSLCVEYGTNGSYCGIPCSDNAACGDGYTCEDVTSIEGTKAKQCVHTPDPEQAPGTGFGTCPCSAAARLQSLHTTCWTESVDDQGDVIGTCSGERVCGEAGLGPCMAPEPIPELCDGLDNDCNGKTDEATCDDDEACTEDTCDAALASPGSEGCIHQNLDDACDYDGSGCTVGDACKNGTCVAGPPKDCDDGNPCTTDVCDAQTGCSHDDDDGKPCADSNLCTVGDVCAAGSCAAGKPLDCDTGNDCVQGGCDVATGKCKFIEMDDGLGCDDGKPCTALDSCASGVCIGSVKDCDDGESCTWDACNPTIGCVYDDSNAPCDDDDACTEKDNCKNGSCLGKQVACDDGNACTEDSCGNPAGCVHTPGPGSCSDGNSCTDYDSCENGECKGKLKDVGVACDDGTVCTDDSCDAAKGCVNKPNDQVCNDGDPCTNGDQCQGGACVGGNDLCECKKDPDCLNKDDGDACNGVYYCDKGTLPWGCKINPNTVVTCDSSKDGPCAKTSCDPQLGVCEQKPISEGNPCDADSSNCTVGDTCVLGTCTAGKAKNCDDSNPCTDDECHPVDGCKNLANVSVCDADDNACTQGDGCKQGICVPGAYKVCDDDKLCTTDSCDIGTGKCTFEGGPKNGQTCDADGSACTVGDLCKDGACSPGPIKSCSDDNPCTDDVCDKDGGCTYTDNKDPCDDGQACTIGDVCKAGECASGGAKPCDDVNVCTQDACDPNTGKCDYDKASTENTPCNADNSVCTIKDLCKAGKCSSGSLLDCDDDDVCTSDACDPQDGCTHVHNNVACDDGDACMIGDVCKAGDCASSPASCDDGNVCTLDDCNTETGCTHEAVSEPTLCGQNQVCVGTTCEATVCGDGVIQPPVESCETGKLGDATCDTELGNGSYGKLLCDSGCKTYDSSSCVNLSWMLRTDKCAGFRQSKLHANVRFAVAKVATWDPKKSYPCPEGYHTATTAEGLATFKGGGLEFTYYNQCGWYGGVWEGIERKVFRFSDSAQTNGMKHAFPYEGAQVDYSEDIDFFAGVVCMQN